MLKKSNFHTTTLPAVPSDGFAGGSLNRNNSTNNGILGMNETSEFDLEESEFNNIDKNEQKEIY